MDEMDEMNEIDKMFYEKLKYELLNYKKERHLEILNQQIDKSDLEALGCLIVLLNELHWQIRDQYLELLKSYVENEIPSLEFRVKFSRRYDSVEKVALILESNRILLSPNENSLPFGDLLLTINDCCKAYGDDPPPLTNKYEIGEVEFRSVMEKTYLQIQKFFKAE